MDSPDAVKQIPPSISQTIHLPNQSKPAHSATHSLCPQMFPSKNLVFILNTVGNREQTDRLTKAVRTLPVTSIACNVTHSCPPLLGGFSALLNEREGSWKKVQSAGTSLSHRDVLYCSRPVGNTTAVRFITALYTFTF